MRHLTALLLAALVTVAGCEATDDAEAYAPPPTDWTAQLAAQEADSLTLLATWEPVVVAGDTVREYVREAGYDTAAVELQDTVQAIGSETVTLAAPPEGETRTGFYCLRGIRRTSGGDPIVAPRDSATYRTCVPWQYTTPYSYPPPPDSLEVDPGGSLAADSLTMYPTSITMQPGDSVDLTAVLWLDGQVVGCSGVCDTVTVHPASWEEQDHLAGARIPATYVARPGYEGQEFVRKRLPWFRVLGG